MTKPKISWPQTPADVRQFIGSSFDSFSYGDKETRLPHTDDRYCISAHDLLSAFADWVEFVGEIESQPQQEPEAWMFQSGNVLKFKWHRYDRPTGEEALKYWKPLYTAPQPQRQPLTDGEILAALDAADIPDLPSDFRDVDIDISRAIEAAHGIK